MEEIVNRVAQSKLVTIDLDEHISHSQKLFIDLAPVLFQGLILREKDFRDFVKSLDSETYRSANVGIHCSADAIIPTWAYMILAAKLTGVANCIALGHAEELERAMIDQAVQEISQMDLANAKVVIKGCGDIHNRDYAYLKVTNALASKVSSIMYGEPCSTVPVFKRKT
ncbi:MAG: DUF2480 family protein [Cyclobacteriaceae bacterium]